MKVKITVSYEIDNLIDEETLKEVYQDDLKKCVVEAIESESLTGIVENETLNVIKVEKLDNKTSDTCECINSTDIFQQNGFIICVECGKKVKLQSCS